MGVLAALFVNLVVVVVLVRLSWQAASQRVANSGEYSAQAQALMSAAALGITSALAWVTGYYAYLTRGLLNESRIEREERVDARRRSQAEAFGGFVRLGALQNENGQMYVVELHNASALPIRHVQPRLFDRATGGHVADCPTIPVALPGVTESSIELERGTEAELRLSFDDDNGRRWLKYGPDVPLALIDDPYSTGTAD